jgi:release factor glutamine methyltransferase
VSDVPSNGGREGAEPLTIGVLLRGASATLESAGCDTARLDAEVLLAHVLDIKRAQLFGNPLGAVDPAAAERYDGLVERRRHREPVAYITGTKGFRRLDLEVSRDVLVPRPETEHLVEAALGLPAGARVCDVGTGSGAVALALKQERPDLVVVGTDISREALAVARRNARYHQLEVEFVEGDLLNGVEGDLDAVVSNPPYVGDSEQDTLPPEVAEFEPHVALFAGDDGLDVIRRLVPEAAARGARFVALEVGQGQATVVAQLLRNAGFDRPEVVADLAGIARVVVGWR